MFSQHLINFFVSLLKGSGSIPSRRFFPFLSIQEAGFWDRKFPKFHESKSRFVLLTLDM